MHLTNSHLLVAVPNKEKPSGIKLWKIHAQELEKPVAVYIDALVDKSGKYACLTFSPDGSLLAAATGNGTLIRVVDITKDSCGASELVQEVCRGRSTANVSSISLDRDEKGVWMIGCTSDRGTTHCFTIDQSSNLKASTDEERKHE